MIKKRKYVFLAFARSTMCGLLLATMALGTGRPALGQKAPANSGEAAKSPDQSDPNAGLDLPDYFDRGDADALEQKLKSKAGCTAEEHSKLLVWNYDAYVDIPYSFYESRWIREAVWMVTNYPAETIAGTKYCNVAALLSSRLLLSRYPKPRLREAPGTKPRKAEGRQLVGFFAFGYGAAIGRADYAVLHNAWMQSVIAHPQDIYVLWNAALFFRSDEPEIAERLLDSVAAMHSPLVGDQDLGLMYALVGFNESKPAMLRVSSKAKPPAGHATAKAFAHFRAAAARAKDVHNRLRLTRSAMECAFNSGSYRESGRIAEQLLITIQQHPELDPFGEIGYSSNTILGRLAIRSSHIEQAKELLLASARVRRAGAPSSHLPDMSLANDLEEKGAQRTVQKFLSECRRFWPEDTRRSLDLWELELIQGAAADWTVSSLQRRSRNVWQYSRRNRFMLVDPDFAP